MNAGPAWVPGSGPAPLPRPTFWARAKKFGVACVGAVGQVFAQGLVPSPWTSRVAIALALLTALGVYQAKNAKDPAPPVE